MARDYANIFTAIWRDPDWRLLPSRAQHTYLMLVTQTDITAAGTLNITITRWAANASDTSRASVQADLEVLEAARFVFVDTATEELLVRTFVKHDKGYGNVKRRGSILKAAKAVVSPRLRQILAEEFRKLGVAALNIPELASTNIDICANESKADTGTVRHPNEFASDTLFGDDGSGHVFAGDRASDALSDGASHEVSDKACDAPRLGVTVLGVALDPASKTSNLKTTAPPALPAEPTIGQRAKSITDEYHSIESMCNWPAVNGVVTKAIRTGRWPDADIRAAMVRLAESSRPVTTDSLRVEIVGFPPSRSGAAVGNTLALPGDRNARPPMRSTTDERVSGWLDIAAAAREASS